MARYARNFAPKRRFIQTKGSGLAEQNFFSLAGLNLSLPDELMKVNETPWAKNFRIFQDSTIDTRVTVSKRNGHKFYSFPVGETNTDSQTSVVGAADLSVGSITYAAQKFTVTTAGRLTAIDINAKNSTAATGPIIIRIYTDNSGVPGTLLATSSILNSSFATTYGYLRARFIEAPQMALSTNYWFVVSQQSEGTGTYKFSTTTSATTAKTSADGGTSWTAQSYALNYKLYISTDAPIKAIYRYYNSGAGTATTLIVVGGTMYSVNDTTGVLTTISSSLSSTALNYKFITVNNCVYFVNGKDNPKKWNGTTLVDYPGSPMTQLGATNYPIDICLHKGLVFLLGQDNKLIWSKEDGTTIETFESTAFSYVPRVNTDDLILGMFPYQDNLVLFNKNEKWVLYGDALANMTLRRSTSTKGIVGINSYAILGNYVYFISTDSNVYVFNGSTDKAIGSYIDRLLKNTYNLNTAKVIAHDNKIRIYYTETGKTYANYCLIYDTMVNSWLWDTEIAIGTAAVFNSQTDYQVLVHGSSLVGAIYYADSQTSDLGKPILFEYRTKYMSFNHPSRKHRIKRLYIFARAGTGPYKLNVQIDVNSSNKPSNNFLNLNAPGATWGSFSWNDGSVWGGGILEPFRLSIPGQARTHQVRFVQEGVDNPVDILGYTTYTKMRRPI